MQGQFERPRGRWVRRWAVVGGTIALGVGLAASAVATAAPAGKRNTVRPAPVLLGPATAAERATGRGKLQKAPSNLDRAKLSRGGWSPRAFVPGSGSVRVAAGEGPRLLAVPPAPSINSAPANPTSERSATFSFSSSDPSATFECRLDNGSTVGCTSPRTYLLLSIGDHRFRVRARNADGTGAWSEVRWTIVTVMPPTILSGPANPTLERSATFTMTPAPVGGGLECRLDGSSFIPCTSPKTYPGPLSIASHTFRVRARNALGVLSPETRYSWTISPPPPPAPTITQQPSSPTVDTSATFGFTSTATGATFECSLDSVPFTACVSPVSYAGLAVGAHTFAVRARTVAGGPGDAATVSWTIVIAQKPVKMRLLVLSADGNETDLPGLKAFLSQIGVPYTVVIATQTPLTAAMLSDGTTGNYQGVILTTGNLTYEASPGNWISALSSEQWQILWDYEAEYRVRQVTSYTYPYGLPDDYGLNLETFQDTLATPLQTNLTAAGRSMFGYLNTSNPVTLSGAWAYLATKRDPTVTPLLTAGPDGRYVIASTNTYPDGRENLAVTVANNPFLVHSKLLSYGLVNWVTRGTFLGSRRVNLNVQIDDLFIDSDMWDVNANSDLTGLKYRLDATDWNAAIAWQNAQRSRSSQLSSLQLEFAFNGEGAEPDFWPSDDLTPAVRATHQNFGYVNHTYTHEGLDFTNYAQSLDEITRNQQFAQTFGFTNYSTEPFVQPDISGLTNSAFMQAAFDSGIRYLISDASRPEWSNPSPNAGFYSTLQPSILIIPRRANNLFYNLRTPEEWVDEYNWYYWKGSPSNSPWKFWDDPQTFEQIIDHESDFLLSYLLNWDLDPWMFHQANLGLYSGNDSLLGDLLEEAFDKYLAVYSLPIRNLGQKRAGELMAQRMAYDASGVLGTLMPCQGIQLTTSQTAVIPLTGVAAGSTESYGGQVQSTIEVSPGSPQSIPVSC